MNSVETSFCTLTAETFKESLDVIFQPRPSKPEIPVRKLADRSWQIYDLFNVGVRHAITLAILCDHYTNNRVLWLANHHPKKRVRKKNYRRIFRWLEREEIL